MAIRRNLFASLFAVGCAFAAAAAPELQIDVDVYDNIMWPTPDMGKDFTAESIAEFFKRCRENGVTRVLWRANCQAANYPSRLNHHLGDWGAIRTQSDTRRADGAFAARVAVGKGGDGRITPSRDFGGIVQPFTPPRDGNYSFSARVSADDPRVFAAVLSADGKRVIARGETPAGINADGFSEVKVDFSAAEPVLVGVFAPVDRESVLIVDAAKLAGDDGVNLLENGDMELLRDLAPDFWKSFNAKFIVANGDFTSIPQEELKKRFPGSEGMAKSIRAVLSQNQPERCERSVNSSDLLAAAVREAEANNVKIYAWIDPVDDGRYSLPPGLAWRSRFAENHPEFAALAANGDIHPGLLCFGYPEVADYKTALVKELLDYGVDGVALKMHFQHSMFWDGQRHDYSRYLYNDIALADYDRRYGKPADGKYDEQLLREIYADYILDWLKSLRPLFDRYNAKLCYYAAPSRTLDTISGSLPLDPEEVIRSGAIDEFLVEPRQGSGSQTAVFERIEKEFGLLALCRLHQVKYGFDYYITAPWRTIKEDERLADYISGHLTALMKEDLDFVGLYEDLNIWHRKLWPMVGEVHRATRDFVAPKRDYVLPERRRPGLIQKATILINGAENRESSKLCDGDGSETSSLLLAVNNAEIEIRWREPQEIREVSIDSGAPSCAENPSGACEIAEYTLSAFVDGRWINIGSAGNASVDDSGYIHINKFAPLKTTALRLNNLKSADTGMRFTGPVDEAHRNLILREIEVR